MSEFELINRLRRRLPASAGDSPLRRGIGDDASVSRHAGPTATSVDAVVEGVHFRREWSTAAQVADKAEATALSDLAAMAADPGEVYVTLGLPADTAAGWVEELVDGFVEAAGAYGVALAGGDTVASPNLFVAVTVVGRAPEGESLIFRSGAAAGDLVAVTGCLGGAAAGLLLLDQQAAAQPGAAADGPAGLSEDLRAALIARHLAPRPLLAAGSRLRGSGVTALVDVSDGLAADLSHLAEASGVSISIDPSLVPVQEGVSEVAGSAGLEPLDLALAGGEDYELAMTVPPEGLELVRQKIESAGCRLTVVGEAGPGDGISLVGAGGDSSPPAGFDHFR